MPTTELRFMDTPDYAEATGFGPGAIAYSKYLIAHGPAYSVYIDGELAMVGGITRLWPRVGEAWSVWTDVGRAHPLTCARYVRRVFKLFGPGFDRIQTDCVTAFTAANRWVRWLGFEKESDMPKSGPKGEHFTRYVLFPGGE